MAIRNAQRIMEAEAARPTPHQIAASAANRGKLGWRAQVIANAQRLLEAGIDPCDDLDDPNIIRDDPPSAA